jgi:cytochrome c6
MISFFSFFINKNDELDIVFQLMKKSRPLFFSLFFPFFCFINFNPSVCFGINLEIGENLFRNNCILCHKELTTSLGNNIIPEKNLKKENLEANGMNSIEAITYQVRNGKNGMPAFGDRFKTEEIQQIAAYILEQSNDHFEKTGKKDIIDI